MTAKIQHRTVAQALSPEQAAPMIASLQDLAQSKTLTMACPQMVSRLSIPSNPQWISGRAATTLAQYFTTPMPEVVMAEIAKDWVAELIGYPSWALLKAFRWWTGQENDKRRNKPMPGDISSRAHHDMMIVRAANRAIERQGRNVVDLPSRGAEGAPISADRAKSILEAANLAGRFPSNRKGVCNDF
jgi:hypothetical protein